MQRTNQALVLNPDQAIAHYAKAFLILIKAKPNDAASANEIIAEAEAALRADPSFATAYLPMVYAEVLLGRGERAISHLEQAMRISPRDVNLGLWHNNIGRALLSLRRYADPAIQEGLKAIDSGYRTVLSYAALFGVLRCGGQDAGGEGRAGGGDELESRNSRWPGFTRISLRLPNRRQACQSV